MYKTFYEYLKPKFRDRVRLLYTDTDSFVLKIESKDLFEEIAPDVSERFDTSK